MSNEIQLEYNLKFKEYIQEGLRKYKRIFYDPYAPPRTFAFPEIFLNSGVKKRQVSFWGGKLKIHEGSGEYKAILGLCRRISRSGKKVKILDVGCANCDLADYLKNGHGLDIDYHGIDISAGCHEYPVVERVDQVADNDFDLIVMTHVAEHMELGNYLENYQKKLAEKLKPEGHFVFAVPNPLNIKNNFCDMTHIQIFPWHETYALLRFSFSKVDVVRLENLNNIFDIIFLPLRIFTCRLVYLDTAKSFIFMCKK